MQMEKTENKIKKDILEISFDPNTIKHLGVSLYSQLPSVLSELVSNSWDADADNISIEFIDNALGKEIRYRDDGHGMSFDDLNEKYLVIGRNRRDESKKSPKGRNPIGKKGLGKLSVFGICDLVTVISVKDGLKNSFTMNLNSILSSKNGTYSPDINIKNEVTSESSYTEIILQKVRRKSQFDTLNIAISLSKKFTIFDEINLIITDALLKADGNMIQKDGFIKLNNQFKFSGLSEQFSWTFPETDLTDIYYKNKHLVKGKIITSKTPIKSPDMRGIYLTSRGKIVNQADFYGARDNDQFHTYVTGYLSIDFIDEEEEDLISTDRHSLNWENDITKDLRNYLQEVIRRLNIEWRKKRSIEKSSELENDGININAFNNSLTQHQRELSDKILDPVLSSPNIDKDTVSKVVKNVIAKFNNDDFKHYASSIANLNISDESKVQLLRYLEEWKILENKQYASLAQTRIEVINRFEDYIKSYTKEVPTLHNFLKDFPWLIDPRILEFDDEVRFSQILKERFPERELSEKDRRIDFLCTKFLGQVLYIVEIKHSEYEIDDRAIEQANAYQAFIKKNYKTQLAVSNVVCYVIGGSIKDSFEVQDKLETYSDSGKVFAKTYIELLHQSKCYHKEFIEKYKELLN